MGGHPLFFSLSMRLFHRWGLFPVTMRQQEPSDGAASTTSPTLPWPNTILPAVANSNRMDASFHHPASAGKTFAKRVLYLGSAIMASTASRQVR